MAETINTTQLFDRMETKTASELFGLTEVDGSTFSPTLPKGDEQLNPSVPKRNVDYYNETFLTEKDWDAGAPVFEKEDVKRSYDDNATYNTDGKRIINSQYFADTLGISDEDALTAHDQLGKDLFGVDDTPDGYWERIKNRWRAGTKTVDQGIGYNKLLIDLLRGKEMDLPARMKEIDSFGPSVSIDEQKKLRAWHEQMLGATVEQLPFTIESGKFGLGGALIGAGIGAKIPFGAVPGAKVGATIAAGLRTGQIESGLALKEMLEYTDDKGNKIDPQIAAAVSLGVGAVNGAVEVGEWAVILSTFGIGSAAFDRAAGKISAKIITNGVLRQVALKHGIKFAGALAAEDLQEIVQEVSVIVGTEIAKQLSNEKKGTTFDIAFDQEGFGKAVADRLISTGLEALKGFPLLLLPGSTISATREAITSTKKEATVDIVPPKKKTEAEILDEIDESESVDRIVNDMSSDRVVPPVKGFEFDAEKALEAFEREDKPIKDLPVDQRTDAIINQPAKIDDKGEVVDEELTVEDNAAIKKIEAEIEADDAEVLEPNLYIGNVTERMKKVFARQVGKDPEDISGFKKDGFLTKRENIKLTRAEAKELLDITLNAILDKLDAGGTVTNRQLAQMNADWGDIKALREVLGEAQTPRPWQEVRAKKHKGAVVKKSKSLKTLKKQQLIGMAEGLEIDTEGTKDEIIERIETLERESETQEERIVRLEQEKVEAGAVRIIESAKETIRAATQPSTLQDANMTVGQVLNSTLKRVAQAASHAFVVGRKEGVAKAKEHMRIVKERLKARKALKVRINKALKRIFKPLSDGVDHFYSEAIRQIQSEIDPKVRNKNTKQRRARQRVFLDNASSDEIANFPKKLFESLQAKALENHTVAELEDIANKVDKLRETGKKKMDARKGKGRLERSNNIKKSIQTMHDSKPVPTAPTTGAERNSEGLIKSLNQFFLMTLRMPRILDWIDGRKGTFDGLMHRIFYDEVNDLTNKELTEVDRRQQAMRDKMDSLNITDDELIEEIDLGSVKSGLKMLTEEIMGVYAALKNPKAKEAMLVQLRISEKTALAIVTNLSPKMIRLADAVIADYADNYSRIEAAYIEFTNKALGKELFYTPIVRLEVNGQVSNQDVLDQLLARNGFKRNQTAKGFTIDRETISPQNQKPMNLRLMDTWRSQSVKQEHFAHFAIKVKELNSYMADSSFRKAINSKLGNGAADIIDRYIKRVASPNAYKGYGSLEVASRKLRSNLVMAYLSYNLLTMLKQAPSMLLYLKDAGASNLLESIGEFVTDPKALLEKVKSKDPQVQHNLIAREFEVLANANDPSYRKLIKKVGKAGLEGIKVIDAVARSIGWNAVYEKEMQLHGSEMEARRQAQNSTLRTQPTASAKDIADLYTQNEVFNWFLMFTQQLNQIWNITTYDTFANWNDKNYQAAATDILAVSLNAMIIWMISNKRLPDNDEDYMDMATDQLVNMIPLIGKDIMGGKKGWGGNEVSPFQAVKNISKAVFAGDMEAAGKKALEESAAANGVPVVAIKRLIKFSDKGDPIELIGGKK
jgi:hypothetical protein